MHVAILGSGQIGATLARRLTQTGHEVTLANSRGPESLAPLIAELGPHAQRGGRHRVGGGRRRDRRVGRAVLPLRPAPRAAAFDGKVVFDATNHDPGRDGHIAALEDDGTTSSELVARQLPGARVVKAFNTMVWTQRGGDGRPAGDRDRLLLFVAGDDAAVKAGVRQLADDIGFDAIDHGGLAAGRAQQPGSAVYGVPLTLAQATRTG